MRMINESQYASLFLNEERHYPEFLDDLKYEVSLEIYNHYIQMIKAGTTHDVFKLPLDCEYADGLLIDATLVPGGDTDDLKSYVARYYNEDTNLSLGKIKCPTMIVSCPHNGNIMGIAVAVSHELTHMYDDWMSIRNGNGPLCANELNANTTSFVDFARKTDDSIIKDMAFLAYTSLKTEKQAFLSQTVQELKLLGCNQWNFRDVMKKTSLYRNVNISYNGVVEKIYKMDDGWLGAINQYIISRYPEANVPTMREEVFDAETYRTKLEKWAKKIHKDIMRRFGSVVSYYVDKLDNEFNSGRSMYVR